MHVPISSIVHILQVLASLFAIIIIVILNWSDQTCMTTCLPMAGMGWVEDEEGRGLPLELAGGWTAKRRLKLVYAITAT